MQKSLGKGLNSGYYMHFLQCSSLYHEGGAHGVMVIVTGCGHDDTGSNPGRAWLHFI